jgi:hypothetical protein
VLSYNLVSSYRKGRVTWTRAVAGRAEPRAAENLSQWDSHLVKELGTYSELLWFMGLDVPSVSPLGAELSVLVNLYLSFQGGPGKGDQAVV